MLLKDSGYFGRTVPQDKVLITRALFSSYVKEAERSSTDTVAKDGDLDVTNFQQRLGRTYMGEDLRRILYRLNPNLIFERSIAIPTRTNIYIMEDVKDPITWAWSAKRKQVCAMETYLNPEYSVVMPRSETVPSDPEGGTKNLLRYGTEIRGWRTVLFRLYKKGLLTEPQIERTFKISESNGQSKHWQDKMSAGGIIVTGT